MNQIYQAANAMQLSYSTNFEYELSAPVRQPGGKRKAPHRRITYLNIPFLQSDFIICESNLERDCAILTALNPEVIHIQCQPETIDLGELGEYTPDFRVSYKSAPPSYIEVKPAVFARKQKAWGVICAAYQFYKSKGIVYELITDDHIEKKDRHLNATYIHRCANLPIPAEQYQRIITAANRYPNGIRMEDLQAITGLLTDQILHSVGNRRLTLNENFEYMQTSMIYPLQGDCK